MTIRELLTTCSFDEVMRHIGIIQYRQLAMRPYYREAWDILLHIESGDVYDELDVSAGEGGDPCVIQCEGNSWGRLVDSPMVIEQRVRCSNECLLAQCLWHLTFYGFSPEEQRYKFECDDARRQLSRRQKITRFIKETDVASTKDLSYLYKTRWFSPVSFQSRTFGEGSRIAYLTESLFDYGGQVLIRGPQLGLILTTDRRFLLTEQEKQEYDTLVASLSEDWMPRTATTAENDDLNGEVKLTIINSKPR